MILHDHSAPRHARKLGNILRAYSGKDEISRAFMVRQQNGLVISIPIKRLLLFEAAASPIFDGVGMCWKQNRRGQAASRDPSPSVVNGTFFVLVSRSFTAPTGLVFLPTPVALLPKHDDDHIHTKIDTHTLM